MKKLLLLLSVSLFILGCSGSDDSGDSNPCATLNNLQVNNLTNTTASFAWSSSVNSSVYQVEYGTQGFSIGSGTQTTVPDTYVNVEDLMPQTQYAFYVRVYCNDTASYSDWAGPYNFVTLSNNPYCTDPSNFSEDIYPDSVTHNKIDLYWSDPSSGGSQIQYGIQGFSIGSGTIQVESEFYDQHATVSGLNSATIYDFYVRNVCEDSGYSAWIGPVSVSTLDEPFNINCIDPYNFASAATGQTGSGGHYFDFTWDHESSQNSWEIAVVPAGNPFSTSNVIATSFNPVRLTYGSLVSGQAYDFYLRSNCGGSDGFSGWIGPVTVTAQ